MRLNVAFSGGISKCVGTGSRFLERRKLDFCEKGCKESRPNAVECRVQSASEQ